MSSDIVICGGGVIGASIAYFLSLRSRKTKIIEKNGLACAASGRAGGFLAYDWCDNGPMRQLARSSFDLHMDLAEKFTKVDYRRVETLSAYVNNKESNKKEMPAAWMDGKVGKLSSLGSTKTTAQVNPYKLTHALYESAHDESGSELIIGSVTDIILDESSPNSAAAAIKGVRLSDGSVIDAGIVIIAMGPWSGEASKWRSLRRRMPTVTGRRAHSVRVRPGAPLSAHAVFLESEQGSAEIYARPDGELYACGESDTEELPSDAEHVKPSVTACTRLYDKVRQFSSLFEKGERLADSACYLPSTLDGLPIIGAIGGAEMDGLYVASGHTCWGILNSLATGKALSELILDGKSSSIDLQPFSPNRF